MTKERLRAYQAIKEELQQLEDRLLEIEAVLYSPKNQRLTGMPSAPSKGNAMEDMAARHIELQDLYKIKMDELAQEALAIEAAIETLDPTARLLFRYRYIDGLKWEEVCVRMNYSWQNVHKIHKRALETLRAGE